MISDGPGLMKWRVRNRISRSQFARMSGITAMSLWRWETGKARMSRLALWRVQQVVKNYMASAIDSGGARNGMVKRRKS